MLSILIPCYNHNITKLIQTIHNQIIKTNKKFEIICAEDGSEKTFSNKEIKQLKFTKYIHLKNNLGRSRIRNFLANTAIYDWLLFIDCDSKVEYEKFIFKYLNSISDKKKIIYGQTKYQKNPPEKNKTLHWKYGAKIESKKKKNIFSSHHFIIHKNAFKKIKFNEEITDYGHEDTIFWVDLKKENYTFEFIKNPLTHIGLETNEQYIKKTKSALKNIYLLSKKYDLRNTSIIKTHIILSKFYLNYIILLVFNLTEKNILKNVLSGKPNLILFQMYKLGYFFRLTRDH